jgi:hypothetical protein
MQPITIAPVTRTILEVLVDCFEDGWSEEDADDIAFNIANALSPQPDPDDPCKWTITLASPDGPACDSPQQRRSGPPWWQLHAPWPACARGPLHLH